MKTGKTLVELAMEIERRKSAKKDYVADTAHVRMNDKAELIIGQLAPLPANDIAHDQLATALDIPRKYYDKMKAESPALLANNVNEWFAKYPAPRMFRTLDGKARAILSNKYRALENEDLAEAVLPPLMNLGLDIMSAEITERRLYIKAVDPKVTRELAKQGAHFGDGQHRIVRIASPAITISNSEVGMGALSIVRGMYDGFCSNLAMFGGSGLRKYHTGARHELLNEESYKALSDSTRRLTDAALWAQVKDVVEYAFNGDGFNELVDKVQGTQADRIEGDVVKVVDLSAKRFGFNEEEKSSVLRQLIEGADLSRFGLYNAITRAAQDVESYDRATELERVGGAVIELQHNEWAELARAA
jgi:hypothetical protein